ncbi:alpha/beta hydrolase [Chelatococcus sambhunathii]|uniref:Alpha/beta hydrolase n=1 Tax=Chelatococcus sambhunathii TaxID=363953 RepID=A0ABU1DHF0_9HYPH|nr:alpha/beta hydrolase [Chelatococcus sambhunathii]MDR4307544.1 alpha/beta hydrolase [Chelatococcus sambhunathii]
MSETYLGDVVGPLPDLFPGFDETSVLVGRAELFVRVGGEGPPVVLLHGYPQTHACWHKVAPALAEKLTLVIPDLRGYGRSSIPPLTPDGLAYSKRAMAEDVAALMAKLGHDRFMVAGHDRGGRVAYRLALDRPELVEKIAVLDIVPTHRMWATMDAGMALKAYHWPFFAQPAPLPERLIGADPVFFIDWTLASWTAAKDLSAFDERALLHYRDFFREPKRIAATLADYRAGATVDREHDQADLDAGRMIVAPLLALWGDGGFPAKGTSPLDVWGQWAESVEGHALPCGHFLPEEAPEETAKALLEFFGR